jgi:hypothetical protein
MAKTPAGFKAKVAAAVKASKKPIKVKVTVAPKKSTKAVVRKPAKPGPVVLKPKTIAKKIVAKAKVEAVKPLPPEPKPARKVGGLRVSKDQKAKKRAQEAYEAQSDVRIRAAGAMAKKAATDAPDETQAPKKRPFTLVPGDVRLIEDPRNGIALMQLEKTSPDGALCVYNNGKRVAVGNIPYDTLRFVLRPVSGTPSITEAAYQLLNPVVATVQVTETAAAHLTAVLNSKEIAAMSVTETKSTEPVAKSKKFAAPAVKAAKTVDPAKKAGKASKAAPAKKAAKESGTSRASLFTVKVLAMPKDGELPPQAAAIVTIAKKLGAGATVSAVIKAMEGYIKSSQTMSTLWSFYKGRLISEQWLTVTEPKPAK